jgi:hypothetical protein
MSLILPTLHLMARPIVVPMTLTVERTTAATRVDPLGRVETLPADVLRHDFDPDTGAYRGWLVEESRANRLLHSHDQTQAVWLTDAAGISWGGAISPDGTSPAATLTEDSSSDIHTLYQEGLSYTAGAAHTLSVFAKSNGRERLQLVLPSPAFGTVCSAVFDLTTATVVFTEGTVTHRIERFADGWLRCQVTATATTGGTTSAHIRLRDTGGVSTYAGDGTSGVHLWGAQLEEGASASSLIETGETTVTRAADLLTVDLAGRVINPAEGTLMAAGLVDAGAAATLAALHDGTADNALSISLDPVAGSAGFTVDSAGATVAALSQSSVSALSEATCAATYAPDDFALSLDASTATTDTAGAVPTGLTTLALGAGADGAVGPRCWIRRVAVFPRRVAVSDLRRLSS